MVAEINLNTMPRGIKSKANKVVAEPAVEEPKEEPKEEAVKEQPAPQKQEEDTVLKGIELVLPDGNTLVHGGPVIDGVRHPFGFSLPIDRDTVKGHEAEYGAGNGVTAHCSTADMITYKINYDLHTSADS